MAIERKNCTDISRLRMKNVIGCYLGQKLPKIRICSTVYNRAVEIIFPWNKGKFR